MSPELICLPIMLLLLAMYVVMWIEARRWKRIANDNFARAKDALDTCHKWESNYSKLMWLFEQSKG